MRVLIVEDDAKLGAILVRGMAAGAITADLVAGGHEANVRATATSYAVIVLDVMLPDLDGFAVCRKIRAENVAAPILFLTARDGIEDRVRGLDSGGDDYLAKPLPFANSSRGCAR